MLLKPQPSRIEGVKTPLKKRREEKRKGTIIEEREETEL